MGQGFGKVILSIMITHTSTGTAAIAKKQNKQRLFTSYHTKVGVYIDVNRGIRWCNSSVFVRKAGTATRVPVRLYLKFRYSSTVPRYSTECHGEVRPGQAAASGGYEERGTSEQKWIYFFLQICVLYSSQYSTRHLAARTCLRCLYSKCIAVLYCYWILGLPRISHWI